MNDSNSIQSTRLFRGITKSADCSEFGLSGNQETGSRASNATQRMEERKRVVQYNYRRLPTGDTDERRRYDNGQGK